MIVDHYLVSNLRVITMHMIQQAGIPNIFAQQMLDLFWAPGAQLLQIVVVSPLGRSSIQKCAMWLLQYLLPQVLFSSKQLKLCQQVNTDSFPHPSKLHNASSGILYTISCQTITCGPTGIPYAKIGWPYIVQLVPACITIPYACGGYPGLST